MLGLYGAVVAPSGVEFPVDVTFETAGQVTEYIVGSRERGFRFFLASHVVTPEGDVFSIEKWLVF